jgi:hypothetical protein
MGARGGIGVFPLLSPAAKLLDVDAYSTPAPQRGIAVFRK